jgi:hypothetical protein
MDPEKTETHPDSNRALRHPTRLYPTVEAGRRVRPVPAMLAISFIFPYLGGRIFFGIQKIFDDENKFLS